MGFGFLTRDYPEFVPKLGAVSMIQIRCGIDPLLLFVQVDLEPDQGVETVPFCFDDRVVCTDVLSIQASFLGDESEDELGEGFLGCVY